MKSTAMSVIHVCFVEGLDVPFDDQTITSVFSHRSQRVFFRLIVRPTVLVSCRQVLIFEMSIVLGKNKRENPGSPSNSHKRNKGLLDSEHHLNGTGMG